MKNVFTLLIVVFPLFHVATNAEEPVERRIDWFGTLESGLKEADRTQKPILLLAAAPQCLGVPGIW